MLRPDFPALVLAPMDGLTDAPMRAVQAEIGAFTYAVSEFVRVSESVLPRRLFVHEVPELLGGAKTATGGIDGRGLPVQVQILGGDPERMALSALNALKAGATAIDINFGCPAPTVNRNDGGATLLKHPERVRAVVAAVRAAVPPDVPVSAKMRLGWADEDDILRNAEMAAEGGASWLTIHGRTREQGYKPPAKWTNIGRVNALFGDRMPVVANGDLWSVEAFRRCRDETGCRHYMLGRGALADPALSHRIAAELGLPHDPAARSPESPADWVSHLERLARLTASVQGKGPGVHMVRRFKQWLRIASDHGGFPLFDRVKRAETVEEVYVILQAGDTAADDVAPLAPADRTADAGENRFAVSSAGVGALSAPDMNVRG